MSGRTRAPCSAARSSPPTPPSVLALDRFVLQAVQAQLWQLHGAPALGLRRLGAVVDRQHLAAFAAQLDQRERLAQRRQPGQLALGGDELGLAAVGHAPALAVEGGGGAHRQRPHVGQAHAGWHRAGEDVGAVVLAQRGGGAAVQQGNPLGPDAGFALVLQPPDQGEGGLATVQRDAPASAQL